MKPLTITLCLAANAASLLLFVWLPILGSRIVTWYMEHGVEYHDAMAYSAFVFVFGAIVLIAANVAVWVKAHGGGK